MSSGQFRDEPRTYDEIIKETALKHERTIWLAAALFFGVFIFMATSFLIHLQVTELSFITGAEEQTGEELDDIPIASLVLHLLLYVAAFLGSIHSYRNC